MNRRSEATRQRIRELYESYGAKPSRWPEGDRVRAERDLDDDAATWQLSLEAGELDGLLDRWQVDAPSPALRASVAGIPARVSQDGGFWAWWPLRRVGWPALALAATAVAGLVLGSWLEEPAAFSFAESSATVSASESDDAAWVELAGLTYGTSFDEEVW